MPNGSGLPPSNRSAYNLSFTAASLRPELSRVVAETFIELRDWALVKDRILTSNSLQCRTLAGAERQERELRRRLMGLTKPQIGLLASATADDRAAIAWLAALKHIRFAFEFAAEVLRDKLATHDPTLRLSDYEAYADVKSVTHPEISQLSAVSKGAKSARRWNRMLPVVTLRAGSPPG